MKKMILFIVLAALCFFFRARGQELKTIYGKVVDSATNEPLAGATVALLSGGCQADTSIDVSFLPDPVFAVQDTSICTYKHQSIILTAPPGFSQYTWNGGTGGPTYQVSRPQKVSLTITDVNGCQTTEEINVVERCPEIYIPNTFTPNNDGMNDTWAIGGLENDRTVIVRVYNRYGIRIFESKGYTTPWDGNMPTRR